MPGKIGALLAAVAAAAGAAGAATWARNRKADDDELELEVSRAPLPSAEEPDAAPSSSAGAITADDLTAIKGLGKVKAARLAEAGVTTFAQVAAWTDEDMAELGLKVNTSPGQIKREDWVGQAKVLAEG
jgi:large subunit ribosomal protein L21